MDNSTLTPGNSSAGTLGGTSSMGNPGSTSAFGAGSTGSANLDKDAQTSSKIDKMADPVHNTVDRLSSAAHHTVDKMACGVSGVADRFSDQVHWISETPPRVLASSKDWIQEKPLQAVGIALAVGYIMGRMRSVRTY